MVQIISTGRTIPIVDFNLPKVLFYLCNGLAPRHNRLAPKAPSRQKGPAPALVTSLVNGNTAVRWQFLRTFASAMKPTRVQVNITEECVLSHTPGVPLQPIYQ